jgi:hypothetical protein
MRFTGLTSAPPLQLSYFGLVGLVLACTAVPIPVRATDEIGVKLKVFVTSEITTQPLPDSMLANPAWQEGVAQCRQQTQYACGKVWTPVDTRTIFSRSRDEEVVILLSLTGIEPSHEYQLSVSWLSPDGRSGTSSAILPRTPPHMPPDFADAFTLRLRLGSTTSVGLWRVEVAVDDHVRAGQTFTITE